MTEYIEQTASRFRDVKIMKINQDWPPLARRVSRGRTTNRKRWLRKLFSEKRKGVDVVVYKTKAISGLLLNPKAEMNKAGFLESHDWQNSY